MKKEMITTSQKKEKNIFIKLKDKNGNEIEILIPIENKEILENFIGRLK